jgi:hypothetical protein
MIVQRLGLALQLALGSERYRNSRLRISNRVAVPHWKCGAPVMGLRCMVFDLQRRAIIPRSLAYTSRQARLVKSGRRDLRTGIDPGPMGPRSPKMKYRTQSNLQSPTVANLRLKPSCTIPVRITIRSHVVAELGVVINHNTVVGRRACPNLHHIQSRIHDICPRSR